MCVQNDKNMDDHVRMKLLQGRGFVHKVEMPMVWIVTGGVLKLHGLTGGIFFKSKIWFVTPV